jgi:hypothetical protein
LEIEEWEEAAYEALAGRNLTVSLRCVDEDQGGGAVAAEVFDTPGPGTQPRPTREAVLRVQAGTARELGGLIGEKLMGPRCA